jgi:uncharacterized RDD family membrane protein YckC
VADLVLETPEGVALRFELAGPGTRILAAALDALLFLLGFLGSALILGVAGLEIGLAWLFSGAVLLLVAYSFLFALLLDGCTPGKLWTGIRVCDAQGFAPRASQLFLRALFVPLEAVLILPVPVVWILIAATPTRQRLGDLVAGTLVKLERPRRAPREPVPELSWSQLESHAFELDPGAVRALEGRDLGLLRDLLTRAELEPRAREALYLRAAQQYAARLGWPARAFRPDEARTFLRELFLCLREVRAEKGTLRAGPVAGAAGRGGPRASGSRPR